MFRGSVLIDLLVENLPWPVKLRWLEEINSHIAYE